MLPQTRTAPQIGNAQKPNDNGYAKTSVRRFSLYVQVMDESAELLLTQQRHHSFVWSDAVFWSASADHLAQMAGSEMGIMSFGRVRTRVS
jgi:hypothetical protein